MVRPSGLHMNSGADLRDRHRVLRVGLLSSMAPQILMDTVLPRVLVVLYVANIVTLLVRPLAAPAPPPTDRPAVPPRTSVRALARSIRLD